MLAKMQKLGVLDTDYVANVFTLSIEELINA